MSGSRDKGQVKLVAAKMKERELLLLLSMMIMVNVIDKSWTMTLAIYDDDDNCSDD